MSGELMGAKYLKEAFDHYEEENFNMAQVGESDLDYAKLFRCFLEKIIFCSKHRGYYFSRSCKLNLNDSLTLF